MVLPEKIQKILNTFIEKVKAAFGSELVWIVLYGSAAENRLRSTSDINLLVVSGSYPKESMDSLREVYRSSWAAIGLKVLFLLEEELDIAIKAFPVKFIDIFSRHVLLYSQKPFPNVPIEPSLIIRRIRQVLLNLRLRLRERYTLTSLRKEQIPLMVADCASTLRSSALSILKLKGIDAASPKEALEKICNTMGDLRWNTVLQALSAARENKTIDNEDPEKIVYLIMDLIGEMLKQLSLLKE